MEDKTVKVSSQSFHLLNEKLNKTMHVKVVNEEIHAYAEDRLIKRSSRVK